MPVFTGRLQRRVEVGIGSEGQYEYGVVKGRWSVKKGMFRSRTAQTDRERAQEIDRGREFVWHCTTLLQQHWLTAIA